MAAGEALVAFRTNIKEVLAEVKAGLDQMSSLAAGKGSLSGKQAELISDIQVKRLQEANRELEKLRKNASTAGYKGESITAGQQRVVGQLREKIAQDYAKAKIPVEFVAQIDANLRPFTQNLQAQVRKAVEEGIDQALVGNTRLRNRSKLSDVYENAAKPAARPAKQSTQAQPAASGGGGGKKPPAAPPRAPAPPPDDAAGRGFKVTDAKAAAAEARERAALSADIQKGMRDRYQEQFADAKYEYNAYKTRRRAVEQAAKEAEAAQIRRYVAEAKAAKQAEAEAARAAAADARAQQQQQRARERAQKQADSAAAAQERARAKEQAAADRAQAKADRDASRAQKQAETDARRAQQQATRDRTNDHGDALLEDKRRNYERVFPGGRSQGPIPGVKEAAPGLYKEAITTGEGNLRRETVRYYRLVAEGLENAGTHVSSEARAAGLGTPGRGFARAERQDYKRRDKGFTGGLAEGLFGDRDYEDRTLESLGKSAGITFKYAALAAVFYNLQNAIVQAGAELLDFEDSLTNIKTAMEDILPDDLISKLTGAAGPDTAFLNDLAESASLAGANVGQAMDLAASAMRTFGDDTKQSKEELQNLGTRFAEEASKIATLTNTDIKDAGGNLKAISLGYELPTTNFSRVTDVLAGSRSVGGGDEKETSQFLANISVAAKEAGFSIEEIGALGSKVIAETDQGGQLVANRFSRLFSIIGGSAGKSAIATINAMVSPDAQVDTTASLRDQILQLSKAYAELEKSGNKAGQQKLINALGGQAQARELLIVLKDAKGLVDEVDGADWSGKGAEQYKRTLTDMRGVLQQIIGDLKGIVTALTQSGLLDPFLLLIKLGLLPALTAIRHILETFNLIPGVIRHIGLSLLAVYATMKLIEKVRSTDAFKNIVKSTVPQGVQRAGEASRDVLAQARSRLPRGDSEVNLRERFRNRQESFSGIRDRYALQRQYLGASRTTAAVDAVGYLGRTGLKNARGGIGSVLESELGPLGLAFAGATAAVETFNAGMKINKALSTGQTALNTDVTNITVDDYNEAAKNLRSSASQLRQSSGGFFGSIVNFLRGKPTDKAAQELDDKAAFDEREKRRLERARSALAAGTTLDNTGPILDLSSTEGLKSSLDALNDRYATNKQIIDAINNSLDDFNKTAGSATGTFNELQRAQIVSGAGTAARSFAVNSLKEQARTAIGNAQTAPSEGGTFQAKDFNPGFFDKQPTANTPAGRRTKAIDAATQTYLKAVNVKPDAIADVAQKTTSDFITNSSNASIDTDAGKEGLRTVLDKAYRSMVPDANVRKNLVNSVVSGIVAEIPKQEPIDPAVVQELLKAGTPAFTGYGEDQALLAGVAPGNKSTTDEGYQAATISLKSFRAFRKRAEAARTNVDTSTEEGRKLNAYYAQGGGKEEDAQFDLTEAQLVRQQADKKVDNARAQFNKAQASKPSQAKAARIQDTINEIDKELAIPSISNSKRVALLTERAQEVIEKQLQDQRDTVANSRLKLKSTFDEVGQARIDKEGADAYLKENFTDKGITSGEDFYNAQADADQKALAYANTQTDRKFAKKAAGTTGEDAAQNAALAEQQAEEELANLEKYAKNTTAYYNKVAEVEQKRLATEQANREKARVVADLATDLSDPVQQAQNDLDQANQKYKDDLANPKATKNTLNADKRDIAKDQLAVDQTSFSQRLNDVQAAHDAGRISNQAYLEYLTSERTRLRIRLAGMKKTDQGYRQAVDQLQQLDGSIKSAADTMSGMFNIGDIDIPTPYQVRTALKSNNAGNILGSNPAGGTGGNVTNDSSTQQVILNGIPVQQVLAIIQDLFGKKTRASEAKRRGL